MASNHTSIYMRGLYDGFQIGIQQEMTPQKFKITLAGMTAICQKIFAYVPIQEAQTANQIVTAMRHTSTRPDLKTATGCLNSLKDAGLVKEIERGLFRQVVPREVIPVAVPQESANTLTLRKPGENIHAGHLRTVTSEEVPPMTPISAAEARELADQAGDPPMSPAGAFGDMAKQLRTQGQALLNMADDMERSALEFEQQIEDANKRLERFNQLKALLAS